MLATSLWAMVACFSLYVNRHLPSYVRAWGRLINQQLDVTISFDGVHYNFPNHLIFKHVNICAADEQSPLLAASLIDIDLRLPISSSGPEARSIVSQDTTINFLSFKKYLKKHPGSLDALKKILPPKNTRLILSNEQFKINANLGAHYITAKGFWKNPHPYTYEFSGQLKTDGFNVNKLVVKDTDIVADLWGRWQNNQIYWKGFIFYKGFYVLDIKGQLDILHDAFNLKELTFTVNNDPVTLTGQCSRQGPFLCDGNFKWRDVYLHVTHLCPRLIHSDFLHVTAKSLDISVVNDKESLDLPIESFLASVHWRPPNAAMALSATIHAGALHGRFFINTSSIPWDIHGQGLIKEIAINHLSSLHSFFKQCQGRLSGHFDLLSLKDRQLQAELMVHNGAFDDIYFLPWLAETLQMPGLNPLSDINLSFGLTLNGRAKMLRQIKLHSRDVDLNGFFNVDADDLASSQMTVRVSRRLLSTFPIGQRIMSMAKNAWILPFEFQLSGNIHKMNFQWKPSALKDTVRSHVFAFVQRAIDRRLDAGSYPLSESDIFSPRHALQ